MVFHFEEPGVIVVMRIYLYRTSFFSVGITICKRIKIFNVNKTYFYLEILLLQNALHTFFNLFNDYWDHLLTMFWLGSSK
jgi:hypothetical protein